MPGMGHSAAWWAKYEALRSKGMSKESAARITNKQQSKRAVVRRKRRG